MPFPVCNFLIPQFDPLLLFIYPKNVFHRAGVLDGHVKCFWVGGHTRVAPPPPHNWCLPCSPFPTAHATNLELVSGMSCGKPHQSEGHVSCGTNSGCRQKLHYAASCLCLGLPWGTGPSLQMNFPPPHLRLIHLRNPQLPNPPLIAPRCPPSQPLALTSPTAPTHPQYALALQLNIPSHQWRHGQQRGSGPA